MPLRDVEAADDISHLLANNQSITIPADVRFISATELPSPRNVAPTLTSITHRLLCRIYCTFALYTNHVISLAHNFPSPKPIISLSRPVTCVYFSLQTIFPLLHPQYLHVPVPVPPRIVIHPARPPPLPGTVSANVYSPDKAVKSVRWPVWSWTLWSQLPSTPGNSSLHTWLLLVEQVCYPVSKTICDLWPVTLTSLTGNLWPAIQDSMWDSMKRYITC